MSESATEAKFKVFTNISHEFCTPLIVKPFNYVTLESYGKKLAEK